MDPTPNFPFLFKEGLICSLLQEAAGRQIFSQEIRICQIQGFLSWFLPNWTEHHRSHLPGACNY